MKILSMIVLLRNAASSQTASLSSEASQHAVTKKQNKRSMARMAIKNLVVMTWSSLGCALHCKCSVPEAGVYE